jgi:hypothetical protein
MSNAVTLALIDNIRVRVSGVTDDVIKLELFNIVDELAREALRVTAPSNIDDDPANWLSSELWVPNYQVILDGTLARLYSQPNRPWTSLDMAKIHSERYMLLLGLARSEAAASPATVYDRLISNLRVRIPMARDALFKLEIYNTADKIRREALRLDPLTDINTAYSSWLPADRWDNCYQALLHGVLYGLYSQVGTAYAQPEMAQAQYILFQQELELVRNELATASHTNLLRFIDMARVYLPGARDNIIQLEFFAVMNDFFQRTNAWREDIDFTVTAGVKSYDVIQTSPSSINRLISVVNENGSYVAATMKIPGVVDLMVAPSQAATYTAQVALTISNPTDSTGFPEYPDYFLDKYGNDILDGLLSRMMTQISKPYSNPQMALMHGRNFMGAVTQAKVEAMRANTYRAQAWRFPQGFANRRSRGI